MKKYIYQLICIIGMFGMSSCFSDDSKQGTPIGEINVTGIEESYLSTSYVGEILKISPVVTSGYTDSELEYTWALLNSKTGTKDENGNQIEPEIIGREKDLDFEVNVAPGTYQIRYEVKVTHNSYTVLSKTDLFVVTEFSQGFYVMKETESGDTDLDLLASSGAFSENLIAQTQGESLKGKPYCLNPLYGHYYVNPETDQMEATNMIAVSTEAKEINIFRSSDLMKVFDRSNLLYDDMEPDEQPVSIYRVGMMGMNMAYLSSNGVRYTGAESMYGSPCVGKYGFSLDESIGISCYAFSNITAHGGMFCWDNKNHSLIYLDYNLTTYPLLDMFWEGYEITQNLYDYECIGAGMNIASGTLANFVLENQTSRERYLYLATDDGFMNMYFDRRIKISPDSHMGKSDVFATNGLTANYIYCIDENKLWACNTNSDDLGEQEVALTGISSNEILTYVSNQYWNANFASSNNYDYLIVGTQEGANYHLYMYNMIGGMPDGEPIQKITGTGKVKSVRFLSSNFSDYDLMFGYKVYPEID